MIYQNIDKLSSAEEMKDEIFKTLVGYGRDEEASRKESFLACQQFRDIYKQPAIFDVSNNRPTTDDIYVPDKNRWNSAQTYAIDQLKGKYAFVEVRDSEALELRANSFNVLTLGDAVNEVLRIRLIEHWSNNTMREDNLYAPPEILDAAYCAIQKTTLYFFRHIL